MAWYAYCITEQKALLAGARARRPFLMPGLTGIAGEQVLAYPSGEFIVVVSNFTAGTLDQKAAFDHARVVADCFKNTTVLPFRFGTIFQSDEALRRAVRANRRAFLESVNHLRGKAEMHLKLVIPDGAVKHLANVVEMIPAAGGEYLARLRERAALQRDRQSKAKTLSVQVHRMFNPLDEEISCKKVDSGGLLIDIAHLIDTKSIEKYQNRYATASKQLKDCQMVLSGPWPPYHFMPGKLRTGTND